MNPPARLFSSCAELPALRARSGCAWMRDAGEGSTMRPRESSPFWVWLTIGLMAGGSAAYVTSYFIIEDFMAVFK
jgi:hypothetical protein